MIPRNVLDIEYQIQPSGNRKTTDIIIERNGVVTVRPARHLKPEQIDDVVKSRRMWIYRNLAEWRDLNATAVVREWVNGESFLYIGSAYRLLLVAGQSEALKLKDGRFCLQRELIDRGGPKAAQKAFEEFYTDKGIARIQQRVGFYAPKIGVQAGKVMVKDIGYRWARCGIHHDLAFHWKCMMAPVKIIDYIAVHELCHIRVKNHTDAFWNEVDKILPDYGERREWLKTHGAGLDL